MDYSLTDDPVLFTSAKKLSNDPESVLHLPQLAIIFGISDLTLRFQLFLLWIGLKTSFDVVYDILSKWRSMKPEEALISNLIKALRELKLNKVADEIAADFAIPFPGLEEGRKKHAKKKTHNEANVNDYISRAKIDAEIEKASKFKRNLKKMTKLMIPLIVLHGIQGIGKTEAALAFRQNWHQKPKRSSIWIDATSPQSICEDISQALNIENSTLIKEIQHQFKERLYDKNAGEWLIVFDNVKDHKILLPYLPLNLRPKTVVIITSLAPWNYNDLGQIDNIKFGPFTSEELSAIAKKKSLSLTPQDLKMVSKYSGRLPYLVNIILSGLATHNRHGYEFLPLIQYLHNYKRKFIHGQTFLNDHFIYQQRTVDIVNNQIQTIRGGFNGKIAVEILSIISTCGPQICFNNLFSEISKYRPFQKLLFDKGYSDEERAKETLYDCLKILGSYSLIQLNNTNKDFKIYICIHQALRQYFKHSGEIRLFETELKIPKKLQQRNSV